MTPTNESERAKAELAAASNACLELAAAHGLATGHGGTVADMIRELFDGLLSSMSIPSDECLVPKSDRDDLDEVCRELGIQDSHVTPAEAVRELKEEIERLSRRGEPVAWLYESWCGEDSWGKHFSFEKPAGNKWQRNIEPLYASPPAPALDARKEK